ncbi:MAG: prepilin-type N-terminal cleavage/methylation domain-containing protein [Candidatus Dependentiae bacterium]|nr:prepilin-type N-terminal cleavage/methylation domain-containing protein [Candidatus Dependentiae bacterium]MCL5875262.1 prepilin-type N-terminal cleavage/methylation domain-containing protein [Candidatus Dependentiae bacterium]
MKQNHSGFTLIELLIATAIAAILSTFIFGLVRQMGKATVIVDTSVDIYLKGSLVQRVMEKDLSGVCVPFTAMGQEEPKKQPRQKPAMPPAPGASKAQGAQVETEKEKKKAPEITKLFYAVGQKKLIDIMTFITNNPLQTYGSVVGDNPKPRIARVVYRLKKKEGFAELSVYTLMRQESYELDFEKFKEGKIPEYDVIDNIASFSCKFIMLKEEEDKEGKKKSELIKSDDWDHEKEKGEKVDPNERRVPHAVEVTVEIGDVRMKNIRKFDFIIPILPDFMTSIPYVAPEQLLSQSSAQSGQQKQQPGSGKGNPFVGTGLNVPAKLQPKSWNGPALPSLPGR